MRVPKCRIGVYINIENINLFIKIETRLLDIE